MRARDALLPAALLAAALALLPFVPLWVGPWVVMAAVFHGGKWATWRIAVRAGKARSRARAVAWFALWPGFDAPAFFDEARRPSRPPPREWAVAAAKTVVGAALFWVAARRVPSDDPLLRGWIGLFGFAWFLLFGTFHLLSCAWRANGVDAQPIWRAPAFATSLTDFWSNRWNLAFRDLARLTLFRPVARRWSVALAAGVVFLASGVVHDLILSVPARGGWGLGTAYFVLQGAGVLFERSATGRRLGLGGGVRGRVWALAMTLPTSFFLFHPWFVVRCFAPLLDVW